MTVSDLGEHALLARLLARLPRPSAQVLVGPGDDAAVLAPVRNERLVVTTDAVVEGVHFSRASFAPADIGHKALAVNLSDLAAMAARSLRLTASALWPMSAGAKDAREKCTPSTTASVVTTRRSFLTGASTAASSPGPTSTWADGRGSRASRRARRACSPRSETVKADPGPGYASRSRGADNGGPCWYIENPLCRVGRIAEPA